MRYITTTNDLRTAKVICTYLKTEKKQNNKVVEVTAIHTGLNARAKIAEYSIEHFLNVTEKRIKEGLSTSIFDMESIEFCIYQEDNFLSYID